MSEALRGSDRATERRSDGGNPQSPIVNPQSPIVNPQSPIVNPQSSIAGGTPSRRSGWQVRAGKDRLELDIYDLIGSTWDGGGVSARTIAAVLKQHATVSEIHVAINSPGGSVGEALAIYNLLARHSARVLVDVDGMAISAASLVVMAGDQRRMAENALMMIHDPEVLVLWASADELRAAADLLDKTKSNIVRTYAARSGMEPKTVEELMSAATWFTADEAVENGLIDEVVAAKQAKPVRALSAAAAGLLNQRFEQVPEKLRARLQLMAAADGRECQTTTRSAGSGADEEATKRRSDGATERIVNRQVEVNNMTENEQDKDQMEKGEETATNTAPPAATLAELKAAFPTSDAEFREVCLENELTLIQAKDRWANRQVERITQLEGENQNLRDEKREMARKLAEADSGTTPVDFVPEEEAGNSGVAPTELEHKEREYKRIWAKDAALRAEFRDFENYVAFRRADDQGLVRIA